MTLEHGRTRYTRGCRCAVCRAAERDCQRARYRRQHGLPVDPPRLPRLNVINSPPVSAHDGSVVVAVRAELDATPAAIERPGLTAVALALALALAEILDDSRHVATRPAAARQLVAILATFSKRAQRPGKLAAVKSMTNPRTTR